MTGEREQDGESAPRDCGLPAAWRLRTEVTTPGPGSEPLGRRHRLQYTRYPDTSTHIDAPSFGVSVRSAAMHLISLMASFGASMNVHSIVGHRATRYFGAIVNGTAGVPPSHAAAYNAAIQSNPNAVMAGADFPDFLYACGSYKDHHDAGEAAHWPPFHAAAVRFLTGRQPDPTQWDSDDRTLAAFIFGIAAHYVADELWEGLTGQLGHMRGFTEMVDAFQLGNAGHGNVAETVANFGGDAYAAWDLDESDISAWGRVFPLADVVQIYHATPKDGIFRPNSTNFTDVTLASLSNCRLLFDLGLWAMQSFGALLYSLYNDGPAHHLPMIQEALFEAPLAGVDDMAATTSFAWTRIAQWLSAPNGPPLTPPKRSTAEMRSRAAADDADDRSNFALFKRLRESVPEAEAGMLSKIPPQEVSSFFRLEGIRTAPLNGTRGVGVQACVTYSGPAHFRDTLSGILAHLVDHYLGSAGVHVRVLPSVATPVESRATPQPSPLRDASTTPIMNGTQPVALLGTAMATADFDADGIPDLAVGAAGAGAAGSDPRAGDVHVTMGSRNSSQSTLRAGGPMARFGSALGVLDFNLDGIDDLVVGAPGASDWSFTNVTAGPFPFDGEPTYRQWGRVYVFLGAKGQPLSNARRVVVRTSTAFMGLGTFVAAGDVDGDGHRDLLLGCPSANEYDGRVLAVASKTTRTAGLVIDVDTRGAADLDLAGPAPHGVGTGYGWFGASVSVSSGGQLLVGAPYHRLNSSCTANCDIVGRVYGFDLIRRSGAPLTSRFSVTGTASLGRLGAALAVTADGMRVAMSAPDAPGTGELHSTHLRAGVVAILNASDLAALHGDVRLDELASSHGAALLHGESAQARLGQAMLWTSRVGMVHMPANETQEGLVLAAPFFSTSRAKLASREVGAIYAWHSDALPKAGGQASSDSATWSVVGARARGRFGSSLCASSVRNGSTWSLGVGSPRATGAGMEQSGAVDLIRA